MTKIIIKRWKEDGMEKVGFYDINGTFHMLLGLAKDWCKDTITVLNLDTGNIIKYKLEEENNEVHVPWN